MIHLSSFPGVDPTGARDTTAAVQAALASFGGRQTDLFVDGTYMVSPAGLTLSPGVSLYSNREGAGVFRAMAAKYANPLLACRESSFYIGGIVFDYSAAIALPQACVVSAVGCSDFEIEDCRIDGQFVFGLCVGGIRGARIRRNRITLSEARSDQNEAILAFFTPWYPPNTDVKIEDNRCINSAMDLTLVEGDITGNLVTGFRFGAGITTEDDAPNSYGLTISGNRISGGVGVDSNQTIVPGIENWAPGSRISGNHVRDNAGAGISNGVASCLISDNFSHGNGGSGLASELERGSNSQFLGNQAFGNGRYGYEDANPLLGGIVLVGNQLVPNALGAMLLSGRAYETAANRNV